MNVSVLTSEETVNEMHEHENKKNNEIAIGLQRKSGSKIYEKGKIRENGGSKTL